ncbi:MAG: type III secretion system stator protein SctL [Myxococcales bacterium]|nr:type III secretion system stator protein SctL [Myxococcales bacterium]MCB9642916.1 type III secretion system stator protein SctL [Myxococcales bacterium]
MSKVIKGGGATLGPPPAARPAVGGYSGGYSNPASNRVISAADVKAQSSAQEIVQKAQMDAERIRAQAEEYRQRGYEEGYQAGLEEGKQELTDTILQLNQQNQDRFRNYEPELVKLAMRIAEKIIGEQVKIAPETVVGIVSKALGNVRHQREIYVRVNPDDYDTIQEHKPMLLERLSRAQDIDIRPDANISPGSCRIESEIGTIDANLKNQLAAIERALLG